MSAIESIINAPTRANMQLDYADPAGLNNIVIGTERRTAINQFDFKQSNILVDGRATTAPATTDDMLFSIRRLNGNVKDIANWTDILPANPRTVKGVMPFGINVGTFQWIMEEIVIAAAGVSVVWTFTRPVLM